MAGGQLYLGGREIRMWLGHIIDCTGKNTALFITDLCGQSDGLLLNLKRSSKSRDITFQQSSSSQNCGFSSHVWM